MLGAAAAGADRAAGTEQRTGKRYEAHLSLSDRLSWLRLVVHGDGLDLNQAALRQVLDGEGGASRGVRGEIWNKQRKDQGKAERGENPVLKWTGERCGVHNPSILVHAATVCDLCATDKQHKPRSPGLQSGGSAKHREKQTRMQQR